MAPPWGAIATDGTEISTAHAGLIGKTTGTTVRLKLDDSRPLHAFIRLPDARHLMVIADPAPETAPDLSQPGVISLETMLRATCQPERLLDLIENFTLFMEAPGGLIKILAKNHQYLGVNNALDALHEIENREGRLGVFWHTQGSGKSISMIFFEPAVQPPRAPPSALPKVVVMMSTRPPTP